MTKLESILNQLRFAVNRVQTAAMVVDDATTSNALNETAEMINQAIRDLNNVNEEN